MPRRFKYRLFVLPLLMLGVGVLAGPPAGAHTGFESSDPVDGGAVDGPLGAITIVFSAAAEPAGEGFEVLDSSGLVRAPTGQSASDGRTWVLTFDPPLAAGRIGVRWKVKAPDKHPIEGGVLVCYQ